MLCECDSDPIQVQRPAAIGVEIRSEINKVSRVGLDVLKTSKEWLSPVRRSDGDCLTDPCP